jgi:hypothetical protein
MNEIHIWVCLWQGVALSAVTVRVLATGPKDRVFKPVKGDRF